MVIDTTRTVEIAAAVGQMALMALGAAAFTAGAAFMLVKGLAAPSSFNESNMYVGISVFGLCTVMFGLSTVMLLWQMVTQRGTVVTIGPEGIRDVRVADKTIPWSAITDISSWTVHGRKIMVLAVLAEAEAGLGLRQITQRSREATRALGAVFPNAEARVARTQLTRWSRGATRALGPHRMDGILVDGRGLKIGFDELVATTCAYAEAWRVGQVQGSPPPSRGQAPG